MGPRSLYKYSFQTKGFLLSSFFAYATEKNIFMLTFSQKNLENVSHHICISFPSYSLPFQLLIHTHSPLLTLSGVLSVLLCTLLLLLLMFSALSKCGNLLRSWLSFIILVNISLKVLPSKSRPCTLPGRHNRASLVSPGMSEPAPKL